MTPSSLHSQASTVPAVQVTQASLIYNPLQAPVHALADIDLSIAPGEFVSLIGPSGCGKTTLLRVIADLEHITSGSVLVNGVSPHEARLARAYGYVFQAPALFPWRTVLGNVKLPLQIQGRSSAECEAIARQHIERVGLSGFESKYPWQLSGGMQQRVAIARALVLDPKLLLLDEPFASVDSQIRLELEDLIANLVMQKKITTIIVTHDIDEAIYLADKVILLSQHPATISKVVPVSLKRPRNQIITRSDPKFIKMRTQLYSAIKDA